MSSMFIIIFSQNMFWKNIFCIYCCSLLAGTEAYRIGEANVVLSISLLVGIEAYRYGEANTMFSSLLVGTEAYRHGEANVV